MTSPELNDAFGAVPVGTNANTAVSFFETNRRTAYSHQFNLGVQRQVPGEILVELKYVGNLSRKLPSNDLSINQVRPELLGPGASQKDRPFPQFSNVSVVLPPLGVSSYHAGTVGVNKRFSHGLSIRTSYTWSKFLDNTNGGQRSLGSEGGPYSDFYNRRADWGPAENDIRHRLIWTSVYEIPIGTGRAFLSNHPARYVLGNWSIGSAASIQSGPPFTVTTLANTTNAFSAGVLRADVSGDPNLPVEQRTLSGWFNTGAFQQPAQFRFGNQGVNIVRADGTVNIDFSILRDFDLQEQAQLQFRAELFNALNHPNFGIPGRIFGRSGFGVVSSSGAARVVQLGLRLTF